MRKEKTVNTAGIFNHSGVELTEDEQRVLCRGLKHLTPRGLSKFDTFVDVQKYIRKININRYLISNPVKNRVKFIEDIIHSRFRGDYYIQNRGVTMNAKFVPIMANLWSSRGRMSSMLTDTPRLLFWSWYIDDILLLWVGDTNSLITFISELNMNDRGFALQCEHSTQQVNFLDLTIKVVNKTLETLTYFKSSDRNSHLGVTSCHHLSWLRSKPKSQFLCLRGNCINI